jgi:hypothetical protein
MSTASFLARKIDSAIADHAQQHGPEAVGPAMYFVLMTGQQIHGAVRAASEEVIELSVGGTAVFVNPAKVIAWSTAPLTVSGGAIGVEA